MSSWERGRVLVTGMISLALVAWAPGAVAAGASTGAGKIQSVAGGPGQGAPTAVAQEPFGVAIGPDGTLYIADGSRSVIRSLRPGATTETIVAGNGNGGFRGDGGLATSAELSFPNGVAVDRSGNLVIADTDSWRVRVVAATTATYYGQSMTVGHIYTVAGNGHRYFSGDGGPATGASLYFPSSVAIDAAGDLLIADTSNARVRLVAASTGTFYGLAMTQGDIYTVAGGRKGYAGDGGPATSARLSQPMEVAADRAGNVVIADTANNRVRIVAGSTATMYGQAMTTGDIYTVAGDGTAGNGGDGGPGVSAQLSGPNGLGVDAAGNLVVADTANNRIRIVAGSTATMYGQAMTTGDIYTITGDGTAGRGGDGGPGISAQLSGPSAAAVDGAGNLVIGDTLNDRVRVMAGSTATFYGQAMTSGDIYTVAGTGALGDSGDGGPAVSAEMSFPAGVAMDATGDVLIPDGNIVRLIAGSTGRSYGQAVTSGDIYTVAGNSVGGYQGDGGKATKAELYVPDGVAVDRSGNLVIGDTLNNRVRVVAGSTATFYGQAMTSGDIYTVAGNGTAQYLGDGGPATAAGLDSPSGIADDGAGNLLIGDMLNQRVRVVAGSTATFYGQAMTSGDIYTIAGNGTAQYLGDGGPATTAALSSPRGVAIDPSGNVVIADRDNNRIRVVAASTGTFYQQAMTSGDIYTVAGGGTGSGCCGDGRPATSAKLSGPHAVAFDGSGSLVIADSNDSRVRLVADSTATMYGQAMKAGDIYTVAGNGHYGYSGDGSRATAAELYEPRGIAVDRVGNLVIADSSNARVRVVVEP